MFEYYKIPKRYDFPDALYHTTDKKLDELVVKIISIIEGGAYYDKKEAAEITELIKQFVQEKVSEKL